MATNRPACVRMEVGTDTTAEVEQTPADSVPEGSNDGDEPPGFAHALKSARTRPAEFPAVFVPA